MHIISSMLSTVNCKTCNRFVNLEKTKTVESVSFYLFGISLLSLGHVVKNPCDLK